MPDRPLLVFDLGSPYAYLSAEERSRVARLAVQRSGKGSVQAVHDTLNAVLRQPAG